MWHVSYIVTVYNKAAFLPMVLNSVAAELAATNGEIVIVDDGSTDESPAILAEFAKDRGDITIISQANSGVAAATNRGIAAAKEPYLRLIDGDDCLVPGSTTLLLQALEKTGCKFAFGQFVTGVAPSVQMDATICIIDDPLRQMLVRQPFIPAATLGLTTTMQQALPLPEAYKTAQDFSLGVKLARLTPFAETSALCCVQPADSTGLSANKGRMFRETVCLALELGQEQNWPSRYRRLAIARNGGRARNYLRRHVEGRQGLKLAIGILAICAKIPLAWPYKRLMRYIATAYSQP